VFFQITIIPFFTKTETAPICAIIFQPGNAEGEQPGDAPSGGGRGITGEACEKKR